MKLYPLFLYVFAAMRIPTPARPVGTSTRMMTGIPPDDKRPLTSNKGAGFSSAPKGPFDHVQQVLTLYLAGNGRKLDNMLIIYSVQSEALLLPDTICSLLTVLSWSQSFLEQRTYMDSSLKERRFSTASTKFGKGILAFVLRIIRLLLGYREQLHRIFQNQAQRIRPGTWKRRCMRCLRKVHCRVYRETFHLVLAMFSLQIEVVAPVFFFSFKAPKCWINYCSID